MTAPVPTAPPESGVQRLLRRAPATLGLIAITLVVFALQTVGGDAVVRAGMKDRAALQAGELWRLVTPLFLHAGEVHLLVNMYSLYVIGPAVERFYGSARLLVIYLLAGVSGVILSLVFNPGPSVGASGAIFGLLGAWIAFLLQHRALFGPSAQAQLRQIGLLLVINLIISLTPGIDAWGHLGGLAAGLACGSWFGPRLTPVPAGDGTTRLVDSRGWSTVRMQAAIAAAGLGIVAMVAILAVR